MLILIICEQIGCSQFVIYFYTQSNDKSIKNDYSKPLKYNQLLLYILYLLINTNNSWVN